MTLAEAAVWPIVGHAEAVALLSRAAASGQVGHAYLISGPEGIGRHTLAVTFTQALLCTAARKPCGVCSACSRVARGLHPDMLTLSLETQAAEKKAQAAPSRDGVEGGSGRNALNTRVSIESVRELRAALALRPLEAPWRVALLEDVDRFSLPAFDALLKTLEEPPPFVVLLLIATEVETVPQTIRSRCRPVPLEPLPRGEVAAQLTARGVAPARAASLAALTRGRLGQALALADDPKALAERDEAINKTLAMIEDPLQAIARARTLADIFRRGKREQVAAELDTLLGLWRDILLASSGCAEQIVNADVAARVEALAARWSLPDIQRALHATYEALTDLSINVQPRLALDRMVTQWPRPSRR
ncbi:MAG TPA: DNA polymerase III subunit [Thermomicrobiaceae bacterium]|nr:DNA polymerase III subunit [Thermomicrobiaceae bacterium]